MDLFEVICHPEKKQGIWLKQLDIAELDEVQGEEESASSLVNQPVYDEIMTSGLGDDNSYLVLVQKEGFSKVFAFGFCFWFFFSLSFHFLFSVEGNATHWLLFARICSIKQRRTWI